MLQNGERGKKENHIGYYLIMEGIDYLYRALEVKKKKVGEKRNFKLNLYIYGLLISSIIFSCLIGVLTWILGKNIFLRFFGSGFDFHTCFRNFNKDSAKCFE